MAKTNLAPVNSTDWKHAQFQAYFKVQDKFQDRAMTMLMGSYVLDLIKFDDWLHEVHGYEEEIHGSTADFVENSFGSDACSFIRSLF